MSETNGDRLPPHNLKAEMMTLGGILVDPSKLAAVREVLTPEAFYRDSHQVVFRAMLSLDNRAEPIDVFSVAEELAAAEVYDRIGGDEALTDMVKSVPHGANTTYYAGIVRQKAGLRDAIEAANQMLHEAYDAREATPEIIARAQARLAMISQRGLDYPTLPLSDVLTKSMNRLAARQSGEMAGVQTGLYELDDMLGGGLADSEVIILAGRPSMGKTALGFQIALNAAIEQQCRTLFFSLEMGEEELGERALAMKSRVCGTRLKSGNLGTAELTRLGAAYGQLSEGRMLINCKPSMTVPWISSHARDLMREKPVGLVVIDYLQLMTPETGERSNSSRQEQVAAISRGLKILAKDLKVPVLALSQLNRNAEMREDHRPRLADLRESGGLEQDADVVILLHRPEYYDGNDQPGIAEIIVAKNRNGRVGTIRTTFLKNFTCFENLAQCAEPIGVPEDF